MSTTRIRLSYQQKGIWYEEQLHPGTSMWNLAFAVRLGEPVRLEVVEEAVARVIAGTDAMRLRVGQDGEGVWQWVTEPQREKLERVDFSTPGGKARCDAWLHQRAEAPLPIEGEKLHDVALLTYPDGAPGFFINVHHVAMDGTSVALTISWILEGCRRLSLGEEGWQPPRTASCLDYVALEERYLHSEQLDADRQYWRAALQGAPELVPIRPQHRSASAAMRRELYRVPTELTRAIYACCAVRQSSVVRVFAAALSVYLFRFGGGEDVVLGAMLANRGEAETADMAGMLANVVPLRLRLDGEITFSRLLGDVRTQIKAAQQHHRYPLELMLQDLREKDPEAAQPFDVVLSEYVARHYPPQAEVKFLGAGETDRSLTMYLGYDHETAAPIEIMVDYRTDLFSPRGIEAFIDRLLRIVRTGLTEPDHPIAHLDLLSAAERQCLLTAFNATAADYPHDRTFVELFEERVDRSPHRVAVEFGERLLTYAELNTRANRLAGALRKLGVAADHRVCILCDRSLEMVPGVLGILKSGAAFVPIDPDYPAERILHILEDSGATVLLTRRHLRERVAFSGPVLDLDQEYLEEDAANPKHVAGPSHLAYVIYTSGSTGKPKGVMIEHGSLVNLCVWCRDFKGLTEADRCSKFAAFGFDVSVMEMLPPLLLGAALHVVPDELRLSPTHLRDYLEEKAVTVAYLPTQFCEQFMTLPEPKGLRWLECAGEALRAFVPRAYPLANEYGPTEYTVLTTATVVEKAEANIPIGKPLPNTQVVILDRFGNLQPVGAPGELCVSGDGIARGYLNRPELTAEKFVPNPFLPGRKMYRTGDLAAWREDGQVEYLGRIDRQVKIRGFRIELGEIETVLRKHPGVSDAVVTDRVDAAGGRYLAAYYVAERELPVGEIRATLARELPDYMVPPYFMRIDRIPLSPNGKIDRKALPEVTGMRTRRSDLTLPATRTERLLVALFKEILGAEDVGIDDGFFALGGQSLRAALLQTRVLRDFGVSLPLKSIFATPTVRALAEIVDRERAVAERPAAEPLARAGAAAPATGAGLPGSAAEVGAGEPAPSEAGAPEPGAAPGPAAGERFPLSHSQRRELITELMYPGTPRANLPFVVRLAGDVDLAKLERAIHAAVAAFDALRLHVVAEGEEHVQVVAEPPTAPLEVVSFEGDEDGRALGAFLETQVHTPFQLQGSDLCRFVLLRFGPHEAGFLMVLHHLMADGWTVRLVTDRILEGYRALLAGREVDATPAPSCRELVIAEQDYLASPACQQDRAWWLEKLGDIPGEVVLPFCRSRETSIWADARWHRLPAELSARVLAHCQAAGTTPYAVFLSATVAWIARLTGLDDVTVGALSHGRATPRERATAGMAVNAFPLRVAVQPQDTLGALVKAVAGELRYILKNRVRYPFDLLVSDLRALNDNKAPSLLNVIVVGQDFPGDDTASLEYLHAGAEQPPYHLILNVIADRAHPDALELLLASPRGMFTDADVAAMCADLERLAAQVVETPERAVARLEVPSLASGLVKLEAPAIPLASAQKRVFLVEQLQGVGTTYHIPVRLDLEGHVSEARLLTCMNTLIARHEALRTSFELRDGEPVQRVHETVRYRPTARDVTEEEVDAAVAQFVRPFDLGTPPLFRIELLRLGERKRVLLLDFHHTICDGTSLAILLQELADLYAGKTLPPVEMQYREFAVAQEKLLRSARLRRQEQFWLGEFKGGVPVLDMPADFPRPATMDYAGDRFTLELDRALTCRLNELGAQTGTTLFMVLLAATNALLARYTGADDIVIGAGTAGRSRVELERTVGMFVNTLPVRTPVDLEKSFETLLGEVKDHVLDVLDNQEYPFERLVERLNVTRDASRNPLFDVAFVLQNTGMPEKLEASGATFVRRQASAPVARVDLMLEAAEAGGRLALSFEYRTSLFTRATIARLAGHLRNLLEAVVLRPESRLADVKLLSSAEEATLVWELNQTDFGFPKEATVHGLFEQVASRFPDRVAVAYEGREMSYRELDARSNQLARTLRGKGVQPDTIVALMLDKCPEMIVGIIAIMKAGGCYLPIKPDFPADRIQFMLENSGTRILVTTEEHRPVAGDFAGQVVDLLDPATYDADAGALEPVNKGSDLVYIIYTSGSTGKPKGVMLEHTNVVRLFVNERFGRPDYYEVDEHDVWSMFHSFCFDFSVWEMYGALLYGGRLVIVPKAVTVNPEAFVALCKREQVTVLSQTPGAFYNFIAEEAKTADRGLRIRYVTFGGEALKPALLADFHRKYPETRLVNMYGITETTVHVTYKEITEGEIESGVSNIGSPIPNLTTYVMDRHLRLLPVGVPGEICVGGDGVARGYLGRPELTAEKFVPSPYRKGERLYRSGDLARMLASGEMEYLGRIDFQVKIRGFRIELGEIENCLLRHPECQKAVVIAKDDEAGAKYIVAYLVLTEDVSVNALREHLLKELPDYMVPAYFVKLAEMPLTPNGKVDRKALPEPGREVVTGEAYVAPRNAAEGKVARAWCKVLGLQQVSVLDNFFALGGHSLKAVSLVAELQKDFEVTVNDIFSYQTVARLAGHVKVREDNLRLRLDELKQLIPAQRATLEQADLEAKLAVYRERNLPFEALDLDKVKTYTSVLLTGATGYLGAYVLRELLTGRDTEVWAIVRGANDQEATARVIETMNGYFGEELLRDRGARLHVLAGDLGADNLGLADMWWSALSAGVDCIIHTAALVKHYGLYETFHHHNVQAVANLIKLATTGQPKDLHHVSTLSVAVGHADTLKHVIFSEDDFDLGQRSDNYYIQTKVEAERLLFEARDRGVDARIYRVGNICVNSATGALQKNIEENGFYKQVKAFVNIGVVPTTEDENDMSFVDQLARAIVLLHDREALSGQTFHLLNANPIKLSEVLTAPSLDLGVRAVSLDDFIDLVNARYDAKGFKPHLEAVMLHRDWMGLLASGEAAAKAATPFTLLSERTQGLLERLGFVWPKLEAPQLAEMVRQALKDRTAVLRSSLLLAGCPEEDAYGAARHAQMEVAPGGSAIVWEGDPTEKLRIVADGHAEVFRRSTAGWMGTLAIVGPGGFLGEESALEGSHSAVSAEALVEDVLLYSLTGEEYRRMLMGSPAMRRALLSAVTDELHRMERLAISVG